MIPDFKTFLKESIWADMEERGTGDLEKEEDKIIIQDDATREELYDFLKEIYDELESPQFTKKYQMISDQATDGISATIFESDDHHGSFACTLFGFSKDEKKIYISSGVFEYPYLKDLADKLYDTFKIEKETYDNGASNYFIYPLTGDPVTNLFFINVIDFILDNLDPGFSPLLKRK